MRTIRTIVNGKAINFAAEAAAAMLLQAFRGRRRRPQPETDFRGEKRSNDTHASTIDREARPYRKGLSKEARLCLYEGTRSWKTGLLVDVCVTRADGHPERIAALHLIEARSDWPQAITLGIDES